MECFYAKTPHDYLLFSMGCEAAIASESYLDITPRGQGVRCRGQLYRLVSNRPLGSCKLGDYKRSCECTPACVMVERPIIGCHGVQPMDALSSHA